MARRIPDETDQIPEVLPDTPKQMGGAPGIEDAGIKQSMGGPEIAPTQRTFVAPAVRRYVYEGPTKHINIEGNIATLRTGQVMDESNYDIATLKRDGVPLRELAATE